MASAAQTVSVSLADIAKMPPTAADLRSIGLDHITIEVMPRGVTVGGLWVSTLRSIHDPRAAGYFMRRGHMIPGPPPSVPYLDAPERDGVLIFDASNATLKLALSGLCKFDMSCYLTAKGAMVGGKMVYWEEADRIKPASPSASNMLDVAMNCVGTQEASLQVTMQLPPDERRRPTWAYLSAKQLCWLRQCLVHSFEQDMALQPLVQDFGDNRSFAVAFCIISPFLGSDVSCLHSPSLWESLPAPLQPDNHGEPATLQEFLTTAPWTGTPLFGAYLSAANKSLLSRFFKFFLSSKVPVNAVLCLSKSFQGPLKDLLRSCPGLLWTYSGLMDASDETSTINPPPSLGYDLTGLPSLELAITDKDLLSSKFQEVMEAPPMTVQALELLRIKCFLASPPSAANLPQYNLLLTYWSKVVQVDTASRATVNTVAPSAGELDETWASLMLDSAFRTH